MTDNTEQEKQTSNWFTKLRLEAGYETPEEFRQELARSGMEKHPFSISLWENFEPGERILQLGITSSPLQMKILAEVLKVTPEELLKKNGD